MFFSFPDDGDSLMGILEWEQRTRLCQKTTWGNHNFMYFTYQGFSMHLVAWLKVGATLKNENIVNDFWKISGFSLFWFGNLIFSKTFVTKRNIPITSIKEVIISVRKNPWKSEKHQTHQVAHENILESSGNSATDVCTKN